MQYANTKIQRRSKIYQIQYSRVLNKKYSDKQKTLKFVVPAAQLSYIVGDKHGTDVDLVMHALQEGKQPIATKFNSARLTNL